MFENSKINLYLLKLVIIRQLLQISKMLERWNKNMKINNDITKIKNKIVLQLLKKFLDLDEQLDVNYEIFNSCG